MLLKESNRRSKDRKKKPRPEFALTIPEFVQETFRKKKHEPSSQRRGEIKRRSLPRRKGFPDAMRKNRKGTSAKALGLKVGERQPRKWPFTKKPTIIEP